MLDTNEGKQFRALFLRRTTDENVYKFFQTKAGLYDAGEYEIWQDPEADEILSYGSYVAIGSYTDVSQVAGLLEIHMRVPSRCPFLHIRDADSSDIMPIIKLLEEKDIPLRLMLNRPECYAKEFRHLYPEL